MVPPIVMSRGFLSFSADSWSDCGELPRSRESGASQLTNTGVWLLIIAQHLALCGAAFYFILTISRFFLVRLALALAWASNALLYTFAHCVGSETLGMIFVVLVVTTGAASHSEPLRAEMDSLVCFRGRSLPLRSFETCQSMAHLAASRGISAFLGAERASPACLPPVDRQRRWLRRLTARYSVRL